MVTAGLYNGWHAPEYMTSRTRLQEGPVWRMIEFLLNGFIFLLIGLQLPEVLRSLSGHAPAKLAWYALAVSLAVVLVRIAWVFPATYIPRFLFKSIRLRDPNPSWRQVAVVGWTGMRGVVSLAAALALPHSTRRRKSSALNSIAPPCSANTQSGRASSTFWALSA